MDPRHHVSPAHRKRPAQGRVLALAVAVAVAAGTLGTGVYLNRESPTWQRILGTEPVVEVAPRATDQLPVLLREIDAMMLHPAGPGNPKTSAALQGAKAMLAGHVELLTPGAMGAGDAPASTSSPDGSEASPAATPPPSAAEFAQHLAEGGNALLRESLAAPEQEARRLSGAGIEWVLAARTLLSATGAGDAQINKLPAPASVLAPNTSSGTPEDPAASPSATTQGRPSTAATAGPTIEKAAQHRIPELVFSACPAPDPGEAAAEGSPAAGDSGQGPADSGPLLGQVIDASYRMGYAYNVAGARTSAGLRTAAWKRSAVLVAFARELEKKLDAALDCAPLRQPAYQLPADARANPMDAASSGEAQLALLLRDAAAAQTGDARAYLLNAAWAQGLQARQVTGVAPDFTQTSDASGASGVSSVPPATPAG